MYWRDVAPSAKSRVKPKFDATDPSAYDWSRYQPVLDEAKARGWSVLLTLSGPVPRWATNGARDQVTRPSPNEFRLFAMAVARHFGDEVTTYSIWNEPNHPDFLRPQFDARHARRRRKLYRSLYFAALRGLSARPARRRRVLVGETAPRGTGKVVAPLTFLRGVLCLNSHYHAAGSARSCRPRGYAHHAYTTRKGPFYRPPGPNDVTIGVLSRLTHALDRAASAGRIAKHTADLADGVRHPEQARPAAGRLARPPGRVPGDQRAHRLRQPARRLVLAVPAARRQPAPRARALTRYSGFESGLMTSSGKPKPAMQSFRLPLAAKRRGSRASLWGLVRPASGPTTAVVYVADPHKSFHKLRTVTTDSRGYWHFTTGYRSGRRFRVSLDRAGRHGLPRPADPRVQLAQRHAAADSRDLVAERRAR